MDKHIETRKTNQKSRLHTQLIGNQKSTKQKKHYDLFGKIENFP